MYIFLVLLCAYLNLGSAIKMQALHFISYPIHLIYLNKQFLVFYQNRFGTFVVSFGSFGFSSDRSLAKCVDFGQAGAFSSLTLVTLTTRSDKNKDKHFSRCSYNQ